MANLLPEMGALPVPLGSTVVMAGRLAHVVRLG